MQIAQIADKMADKSVPLDRRMIDISRVDERIRIFWATIQWSA